nr:hypothetical protein [Tanacetum cinerariifolium]
MEIETEKNAASGSTVIDENKDRDDQRQNLKKRGTSKDGVASLDQRVAGVETSMAELKNQVEGMEGLDSDFAGMREDFLAAFNTLSGDLKREIHDIKDSFMGEIMKIREEFGEEVSILHQTIKDLQADMALCKRSLASRGGNSNHGLKIDVPKPSKFVGKQKVRAVDDFLWEIEQYLEGVNVVDDASKIKMATRYLKDTASRLHKLKQSRMIREYGKEFTTLVLEILELSDQEYLFYFFDGLQGWAKTELEQRGIQDLFTAISYAEALIDFSTMRESCYKSGGRHRARDCPKKASLNGLSAQEDEEASDGGSMGSIRILNAIKAKTEVPKVVGKGLQYVETTINDVKVRALVDSGATHNFVADDKAKRLWINATKGSGTIKAVNSLAKAIHGVAKDVRAKIAGVKTYMVSMERDAKSGAKTFSDMQFKKGFKKSEPCYLAVTRLETDEGSSKVKVPKVIERVLDEFKDVMPKELPKKLPPRREVDHTIELETGSKPHAKSPYRMPPPKLEELRNQRKELMDAGYIRPSKASYGAPMLFQRKKDGSLRMCIDYRALNKVTIKNKYPIPPIADLFDQLGKERYFTKLDLRSGYYQVRITEGDEAKTTCVTRYGFYEFIVMPFGLTDASAIFFTLMNKLFHPFLDKFVVVYLDDIVVYSHTLEEHVSHLKQVFHVLRDNELYVKLDKCSFAQDEVKFLGHKIKDGGLMMDGAKIKAIQDWEPPTKVTELRYFLGLVNYYQRFIMGYSAMASPLTDLLKKNKAWIWDEECQAAFESLKKVVMEEPALRLPDVTMPFELYTDALDFAIGGVQMQDKHSIAFESQKLNEMERKDYKDVGIGRGHLLLAKDRGQCRDIRADMPYLPTRQDRAKEVGRIVRAFTDAEGTIGKFAPPDVTADDTAKLFFKNVAKLLDVAQFSYNMQQSEATRKIPFELEWHEQANLARASLDKAAKKMKKWADEKRRHVEFEVEDQVMTCWKGILLSQLPPKLKIHPVFHVNFLKPYHGDEEDPERGVSKWAPTAVVTSYDREVEEILLDHTIQRRGVPSYKEYLIKWRDLPDSKASWEAEDLLWQFTE